jgi:hypothetical protein
MSSMRLTAKVLPLLLLAGLRCSSSGPSRADAGSNAGTGGGGGSGGRDSGSAGAGGATGGTGGSAPVDGGAPGDGPGTVGPPDAPLARDTAPDTARDTAGVAGPDGGAVASPGAALDGYVFSVKCPADTTDGQCDVPDAARLKTSAPLRFGGDPGTTYRIRLHFCGPVEGRKYEGCKPAMPAGNQLFCIDGTPVAGSAADQFVDTYPTYEMKVSAPAHSYFINSRDLRDTLMKIDYSAELEIQGGSTITFATTSREPITFTARKLTPPITCPGVPGITQPFPGQFIHVTLESITPK